jgi:DNA-binding LacI/PurR family transcriptional regulator
MGRAAADALLELGAGDILTSTHVELATTLVRESTAPPRTA